jgi:hypothetical protein
MDSLIIPWYISLMWAFLVSAFWRYRFSDPVNHWLVCILVFAINFLFFKVAFLIFSIIALWTLDIFKPKNENNKL